MIVLEQARQHLEVWPGTPILPQAVVFLTSILDVTVGS